jgi:hypothetical protein
MRARTGFNWLQRQAFSDAAINNRVSQRRYVYSAAGCLSVYHIVKKASAPWRNICSGENFHFANVYLRRKLLEIIVI